MHVCHARVFNNIFFGLGTFWKSPSQFLRNTKKHIFNTYAFTNAIGLRRGYTIAFPSIFNLFMRVHKCVLFFLWKHIPNIYIFHRHVIVGGNTFLIHSRLQSLFGLYVGKHIPYVFMYYLHTFGKHTRASMLLLANEEGTHARYFVFWSILLDILTRFQMQLLSSLHARPASVFSREHCVSDLFWPRDSVPAVKAFQVSCDKKELQDLKSCNVALCATAVPGSAMLSRI